MPDLPRLRCPRGHSSWDRTNSHFWCYSCARHGWDIDPEFEAVVDARTGREFTTDELAGRDRAKTAGGPA